MQQVDPFKERLAEALEPVEGMRCVRVFTNWCLYHRDHFIGVIKGTRLYLRTNRMTKQTYLRYGMEPLHTAERALRRFYQVPPEVVDDPDELLKWILEAASISLKIPMPRGEYAGG